MVRRVALRHLDFLDEVRGDLVDQRRPVALRREPGDGTRTAGAVQRNRIQFRRRAAQADADDIARLFVHRDTGEILQEVPDVSVGHVAVGIHGDHVLDILRGALPREGGGIALALPGHRERVHEHGRAPTQGNVQFRCAAGSDNDGLRRDVESGGENPHGRSTRRQRQHESAVAGRKSDGRGARHGDFGALERGAGGGVGDAAGDCGGGVQRGCADEGEKQEEITFHGGMAFGEFSRGGYQRARLEASAHTDIESSAVKFAHGDMSRRDADPVGRLVEDIDQVDEDGKRGTNPILEVEIHGGIVRDPAL